jgi:hypothetical protein
MSFSSTVRGKSYLGGPGGLVAVYGDWSGASGDAAGTMSIGGRLVGSLWFKNDKTTVNQQTAQVFPAVDWDGNIPGTLTIQNQDDVTTGSFILFTLGS